MGYFAFSTQPFRDGIVTELTKLTVTLSTEWALAGMLGGVLLTLGSGEGVVAVHYHLSTQFPIGGEHSYATNMLVHY